MLLLYWWILLFATPKVVTFISGSIDFFLLRAVPCQNSRAFFSIEYLISKRAQKCWQHNALCQQANYFFFILRKRKMNKKIRIKSFVSKSSSIISLYFYSFSLVLYFHIYFISFAILEFFYLKRKLIFTLFSL